MKIWNPVIDSHRSTLDFFFLYCAYFLWMHFLRKDIKNGVLKGILKVATLPGTHLSPKTKLELKYLNKKISRKTAVWKSVKNTNFNNSDLLQLNFSWYYSISFRYSQILSKILIHFPLAKLDKNGQLFGSPSTCYTLD